MIPEFIRKYEFIVSGETIRALIITVMVAVVITAYKQDLGTVTDWTAWARGLGVAGGNAAIAFLFGRIPPSKPVPLDQ